VLGSSSAWSVDHDNFRQRPEVYRHFLEELAECAKYKVAYHSQMNGHYERTIQTLEDMLRACVLYFKGNWEEQLYPVEFAYNNGYQ